MMQRVEVPVRPLGLAVVTDLIRDNGVTAARISVVDSQGTEITATGSARRNPTDRDNKEMAQQLAVSRALRNLGRKLEKRTLTAIDHIEHTRQQQAQAAQRPPRKS